MKIATSDLFKLLTPINHEHVRVVFNEASKVILILFGFALIHSVIGLENSRQHLNQSNAKQTTWSPAFSRASIKLLVLSSHW